MKSMRGILAVVSCALATMQAWAAVEIADNPAYVQGATPVEGCAWETGMVSSAVSKSKQGIAVTGAPPSASTPQLSLEVTQLKVSPGAKKTEHVATVRGSVSHQGKLLATRDFQERESIANEKAGCNALRTVGTSIGENIGDWIAKTQFMECGDDCVGIHPDETIVIGVEALLAGPNAVNDTVRNDCRVSTAMVSKLVSTFNDEEPPPRAKLESRAIDIEKYPGRRLILRVNTVHAVGGGLFSGPKWMNSSGELWDGKSKVASFVFNTYATSGLTTCRAVNSMVSDSASSIADWLRNPSLDARLR